MTWGPLKRVRAIKTDQAATRNAIGWESLSQQHHFCDNDPAIKQRQTEGLKQSQTSVNAKVMSNGLDQRPKTK